MDLRQLAAFIAVVDQGTVSRAAEHLRVAQPSLSQTIAKAERDLGVPLFHRVGRRLVLSDAGKRLVGPARVVLRDLEAARSAAVEVRELREGRLDIISMPSPGVEPLAWLIDELTRQHPRLTYAIDAAFTRDDVLDAVRSGVSEIGLLGSAEKVTARDLDVIELEEQPLIVIFGPRSAPPPGPTVSVRDLSGAKFIATRDGSLTRDFVGDLVARDMSVSIVAEVGHRSSVIPLVTAGLGEAVVTSAWAYSAAQAGAKIRRFTPPRTLHVVMVSRPTHLTPAAIAMMGVARSFAALPR